MQFAGRAGAATLSFRGGRVRFPIRIKDEDAELWQQVQDKAAGGTMSINTIVIELLRAWVAGKISIGARRT